MNIIKIIRQYEPVNKEILHERGTVLSAPSAVFSIIHNSQFRVVK